MFAREKQSGLGFLFLCQFAAALVIEHHQEPAEGGKLQDPEHWLDEYKEYEPKLFVIVFEPAKLVYIAENGSVE